MFKIDDIPCQQQKSNRKMTTRYVQGFYIP